MKTNVVSLLSANRDRFCRDCSVKLGVDNWHKSCQKQKQYWCKKCWNQIFYLRTKKYKYGLEREDFEGLLRSFGGKCAICLEVMCENGVCVDHDHKTGFVRGLLCRQCNSGLGFFAEDTGRLERATWYLEAAKWLEEWYGEVEDDKRSKSGITGR